MHARWLRVLGFSEMLLVVLLWTSSSELTQEIFSGANFDFRRPFFLTVFNSAFSATLLLPQTCSWSYRLLVGKKQQSYDALQEAGRRGASVPFLAVVLGSLWFCSAWAFNSSLAHTSVATNTVLSSSTSAFTFAFSLLFLGDSFRCRAFIGVLCATVGCIVVALQKSVTIGATAIEDSIPGEGLTLLSSALFALTSVLLKKHAPANMDMSLFFGLIGLFVIGVSPVLLLGAHITRVELFSLPDRLTLGALGVNAFFGCSLSSYLWGSAMLLLTPVVANVILSLTIPVSALADSVVLRRQSFSAGWLLGAGLVVAALILVAFDLGPPETVDAEVEDEPPGLSQVTSDVDNTGQNDVQAKVLRVIDKQDEPPSLCQMTSDVDTEGQNGVQADVIGNSFTDDLPSSPLSRCCSPCILDQRELRKAV